jgi:hypothetical protein
VGRRSIKHQKRVGIPWEASAESTNRMGVSSRRAKVRLRPQGSKKVKIGGRAVRPWRGNSRACSRAVHVRRALSVVVIRGGSNKFRHCIFQKLENTLALQDHVAATSDTVAVAEELLLNWSSETVIRITRIV